MRCLLLYFIHFIEFWKLVVLKGRRATARTIQTQDAVLNINKFWNHYRKIAHELSVNHIIPFQINSIRIKSKRVQTLLSGDLNLKLTFHNWLQGKIVIHVFKWGDVFQCEACFSCNSVNNFHNNHVYVYIVHMRYCDLSLHPFSIYQIYPDKILLWTWFKRSVSDSEFEKFPMILI